jgi:hypothetical protein
MNKYPKYIFTFISGIAIGFSFNYFYNKTKINILEKKINYLIEELMEFDKSPYDNNNYHNQK